jgi:hypothetical protein
MRRLYGIAIIAATAGWTWAHAASGQDGLKPILHDLTAEQVLADFKEPPPEYSITFYWGWDGPVTEEVIARDLDTFKAANVRCVTVEAGYQMAAPYLSPDWFKLIKFTVDEAAKRNMRVYLVDEGKYPSGFAGGKFSEERPDLRMQTFRVADSLTVEGGQNLSREVASNAICVVTTNDVDGMTKVLEPKAGHLEWTAPEGTWRVQVVEQQFRTSATRSVNNPKGNVKDGSASLCDYLNPAAVRQFIDWTHEQYKVQVGDQFGKTVLGFRGDEPDYGIVPWTAGIVEEFQTQKGYDVRPYLPWFVAPRGTVLTDEQKRAKADYWDVWSNRFGEVFFKMQADWCAANNVQYLVHLNHEDDMVALARSEGDFFRCMRSVQMPGVDAIWSQIWMDHVADYPKFASSAAHLFGRPRSFTESFAAYRPAPNVAQAAWVLNEQLVRGINMVEVMWIPASSRGRSGMTGWLADANFPATAAYIQRACYLLSQGRPTAQIAVYQPTMSLWLGDDEANKSMLSIAQELLEQQRDFDFVDDRSICSVLKLEGDRLVNLSGQGYRVVIVPSATAMSHAALDRLKAFAAAGGKVIFLGREPSLVVDRSFLNAKAPADLRWAIHEPSGAMFPKVLNELPDSDVSFDLPAAAVKYVHRRLSDANLYFFFNEGDETQSRNVRLAGKGQVQRWNAMTGTVEPLSSQSSSAGSVSLELALAPYQTQFIVVK